MTTDSMADLRPGDKTNTMQEVEKIPNRHVAPSEEDPHVAAAEDAKGDGEKMTTSTLVAIFFLGFSVAGPISCGQLMIGSILTPVIADIGGAGIVSWVISGWAIASAVSFAIAGRLSDIFGRRYIILLGNFLGVIGSIVGATAQSMNALVAGSVILGIATGFCLVVFAAVPELCPYKYRGVGLAWCEFCLFVPFGACAAIFANLFVEHATWRWVYYIAIIYTTLSLVGSAVFYFPPSSGRKLGNDSRWQGVKKLDYTAIFLFGGGLATCLLGLSWAGTPDHPWSSASVVAPIILGFTALVSCFVYDFKLVSDNRALFPWSLFRRFREFTVVLVVSFVAGMIYYPFAGLLPRATLYIFTNDPVEIGIILLPNGMGQFFGSTVIPALLHLTKAPKAFIVAAVFLQTLFVGLYVYGIEGHRGAWMAFQFFGQGCFDWTVTCSIVNTSLHVLHSDLGVAIGLLGVFRSFGGSVGNAIFQAVLTGTLNDRLATDIAQAVSALGFSEDNLQALIEAAEGSAVGISDTFANVPGGVSPAIQSAAMDALRSGYTRAFQMVFYSSIPFGVIALIAAVFIKDAGKYMTNHVSVHLEKETLNKNRKHESE